MLKRLSRRWLTISCLTILIAACGGGGGSGGSSSSSDSTTPAPSSSPSQSPTPTPEPSISRSVHLTWTAPSTRADGSALAMSAIQGYRLFYTRDGSNASEDTAVLISGGSTTSTNVLLTTVGTYTFAITAIDTSGIESALSSPVSTTVN